MRGDLPARLVLWWCAATPLLVLGSILAATSVTPGYDTTSDTLSQLAVKGTPHPWVIAIGLALAGLMLQGFAWAIHRRLHDRVRADRIGVLIAISGLAIQIAAFVHDDPHVPGAPSTMSGAIHGGLATIAFGSLIVALFTFVRAMGSEHGYARVAAYSFRIGVVCAVVGGIFEIQVVQSVEGLLQRAFVTLFAIWIEVVIFGFLLAKRAVPGPSDAAP
jgi:hypothetical membrane protein